jgi:hypothetical protein
MTLEHPVDSPVAGRLPVEVTVQGHPAWTGELERGARKSLDWTGDLGAGRFRIQITARGEARQEGRVVSFKIDGFGFHAVAAGSR